MADHSICWSDVMSHLHPTLNELLQHENVTWEELDHETQQSAIIRAEQLYANTQQVQDASPPDMTPSRREIVNQFPQQFQLMAAQLHELREVNRSLQEQQVQHQQLLLQLLQSLQTLLEQLQFQQMQIQQLQLRQI